MKSLIRSGVAASFSLCVLLGACDERTQPEATSSTTETQSLAVDEGAGVGDGSIVCPGHISCPPGDWYGLIIPGDVAGAKAAADRPSQVVCVAGDPSRPTICPKGTEQNLRMEGRLWNKTNAQFSCYPGKADTRCPRDAYAFFCRKNDVCPGVPGTSQGTVAAAPTAQ